MTAPTLADWFSAILKADRFGRTVRTRAAPVAPDAGAVIVAVARQLADSRPLDPDLGRMVAFHAGLQEGRYDPVLSPFEPDVGMPVALTTVDGLRCRGRVVVDETNDEAAVMLCLPPYAPPYGPMTVEVDGHVVDGDLMSNLILLTTPDGRHRLTVRPCLPSVREPRVTLAMNGSPTRELRLAAAAAAALLDTQPVIRMGTFVAGVYRLREGVPSDTLLAGTLRRRFDRLLFGAVDHWATEALRHCRTPTQALVVQAIRHALRRDGNLIETRLSGETIPGGGPPWTEELVERYPASLPSLADVEPATLGDTSERLLARVPDVMLAIQRGFMTFTASVRRNGHYGMMFFDRLSKSEPDGGTVVATSLFVDGTLVDDDDAIRADALFVDALRGHPGWVTVSPHLACAWIGAGDLLITRLDAVAALLTELSARDSGTPWRVWLREPAWAPAVRALLGTDVRVTTYDLDEVHLPAMAHHLLHALERRDIHPAGIPPVMTSRIETSLKG